MMSFSMMTFNLVLTDEFEGRKAGRNSTGIVIDCFHIR